MGSSKPSGIEVSSMIGLSRESRLIGEPRMSSRALTGSADIGGVSVLSSCRRVEPCAARRPAARFVAEEAGVDISDRDEDLGLMLLFGRMGTGPELVGRLAGKGEFVVEREGEEGFGRRSCHIL
jgi:hypothetical protein